RGAARSRRTPTPAGLASRRVRRTTRNRIRRLAGASLLGWRRARARRGTALHVSVPDPLPSPQPARPRGRAAPRRNRKLRSSTCSWGPLVEDGLQDDTRGRTLHRGIPLFGPVFSPRRKGDEGSGLAARRVSGGCRARLDVELREDPPYMVLDGLC